MRTPRPRALAAGILLVALALATAPPARAERLRLATTTSTENSGLLAHLAPLFTAHTGVAVDVIAVGTGQALEMGRRGDVDALLVHHRAGEEAFVRAGHGTDRRDVMYNDFVIVGPASDPAGVLGLATAREALAAIADAEAPFLSRGDDSGTHRRERALWASVPFEPDPRSNWYRETGAGMGRTLNTAVQMDAYTLSDRGTWLAFANKNQHRIVLETDPPLDNPYSSVLVTSPRLSPAARRRAFRWHDWLTGPEGQRAIAAFRVNGERLFHPSAAGGRPHSN